MRHKNKGRKFGRKRDQRQAFLKSLAANLILKGKIKTTEARAKEMRHMVERLISRTRHNDLAGIRYAEKLLDRTSLKKLIKEVAPKYENRAGGYVRISKLGRRPSDGAPIAFIEFV